MAPNDPDFSKQWGLENKGQADCKNVTGTAGVDIKVLPVWEKGLTGSESVLVAVIDTGINLTHPDLEDSIYTNPGEIPGNHFDDDHNGYEDDVSGWNSARNNGSSADDHGHGSHCAGVIGASAHNGLGIAGVNQKVSLLSVKFLSADGTGTSADAIEAIAYARKLKAHVMSNSWGGGRFSQALMDEIVKTKDAGILFVAAAGNNNQDADKKPHYPSSYNVENIISVAASNNKGEFASFSNFGQNSVHVAAPGQNIWSTVLEDKYACFSGTSMATPHVAGVAALMLANNGSMSPTQIKQRLMQTADPLKADPRKKIASGNINAYRAIFEAE